MIIDESRDPHFFAKRALSISTGELWSVSEEGDFYYTNMSTVLELSKKMKLILENCPAASEDDLQLTNYEGDSYNDAADRDAFIKIDTDRIVDQNNFNLTGKLQIPKWLAENMEFHKQLEIISEQLDRVGVLTAIELDMMVDFRNGGHYR